MQLQKLVSNFRAQLFLEVGYFLKKNPNNILQYRFQRKAFYININVNVFNIYHDKLELGFWDILLHTFTPVIFLLDFILKFAPL